MRKSRQSGVVEVKLADGRRIKIDADPHPVQRVHGKKLMPLKKPSNAVLRKVRAAM